MDIILLALLAGYFIFKLYQALGQEDEEELNNRVHAPLHRQTIEHEEVEQASSSPIDEQTRTADGFDVRPFLIGAKRAFEMIISAYAESDTQTLKPLLSPELYELYVDAIEKRKKKKETLENMVIRIKSVEILNHKQNSSERIVTVKFISEQIFVLKDKDGRIIEGDPDLMEEMIDIWTFSRDTRSKDPNWILVSSQSRD